MIWVVTFEMSAFLILRVPTVADSGDEAIKKARQMIPFVESTWKTPFYRARRAYSWDNDSMLCDLEKVLEDLCDYLVKGGSECRPEFLAGIEHYIESRNAVCKAYHA